jgi:hypothetical protein
LRNGKKKTPRDDSVQAGRKIEKVIITVTGNDNMLTGKVSFVGYDTP